MITDDDIRRTVGKRGFQAGVRYQLEGRVQELAIAPDGHTINASVHGSERAVYEQSIRLNRRADGGAAERHVQLPGGLQLQARRRRPARTSWNGCWSYCP